MYDKSIVIRLNVSQVQRVLQCLESEKQVMKQLLKENPKDIERRDYYNVRINALNEIISKLKTNKKEDN